MLLSPLEFIEKLSAIIPPPYRHQVNYYRCLSSHSKLRPLIVPRQEVNTGPAEKKPTLGVLLEELLGEGLEEEAEKPSRYIPWAELLKRTFGIDLMVCPHCGGHVRVIATIIRKEAIREILVHLNLPPLSRKVGEEHQHRSVYFILKIASTLFFPGLLQIARGDGDSADDAVQRDRIRCSASPGFGCHWGIVSSTILTLAVLPALYRMMDRRLTIVEAIKEEDEHTPRS